MLCWVQEATRERRAANAALVAERRAAGAMSSTYNGVSWYRKYQQWAARVRMGGARRTLGYFDDEAEAAKAVDKALVATGRDGEDLDVLPPVEEMFSADSLDESAKIPLAKPK